MKKLIFSLLFGAMALTGAAQQDELIPDDTSFRCQIEGQDITLPCRWSDLERIGWSLNIPEDSTETVLPTYDLLLLDGRYVSVLSPQKRKADILFCNVSDKELTRMQSVVFGISYTSDNAPTTVYDFKLSSGIAAGISTERDVRATYGEPGRIEISDLDTQWRYAEPFSNSLSFIMANHETEVVPEGTVIGFIATADAAVREMIEQAGFDLSDEQVNDMRKKRMYEQNIAGWTKELQLSATDSVRNNPIYISQIKYALAMNNYNLGNLDKAFEWMLPSAEAGNREAAYSIGVMYSRGDGVEQDYHAAASWYEKAALQGQAEAMNNLGNCYDEGAGVEQSDAKALEWWLQAAKNGFSPLYVQIGDFYRDGLYGVKRDYKQAIVWYEKAANSGDPIGIYNLSYMYYNGHGVKRDYHKSFEILLDADMGKYYVQQALGEHYYYGRGVEKDIQESITYFNNFLSLIWSEDAETNEACAKEIAAARKIIDKNPKFQVKIIRSRRIK